MEKRAEIMREKVCLDVAIRKTNSTKDDILVVFVERVYKCCLGIMERFHGIMYYLIKLIFLTNLIFFYF